MTIDNVAEQRTRLASFSTFGAEGELGGMMDNDLGDAELVSAEVQVLETADGHAPDETFLAFGGRVRKEYGPSTLTLVRCPLFILASPGVPGCKTTLKFAESAVGGLSLELKLFGNGVSLGRKITVSLSQEVSSSDGARKRIFMPLWLEVKEVTTYFDDGREEQVGYEMDLRLDKMALNQIGVDRAADWSPSAHEVRLLSSLLKDDEGPDPVTQSFGFEVESAGGLEVGFKALDADHTLKLETTFNHSQEFTAELVPGHDYVAMGGAWPPYVSWNVDGDVT